MDPVLGEVRMFAGNYAPQGWLFCNGQVLQIAEYDALYSLIGNTYGGDGMSTFALPDLRGRTPIHQGNGPGLSNRVLGQSLGRETVTLTTAQLPQHPHPVHAVSEAGDTTDPTDAIWAAASTQELQYTTNNPNASMDPNCTTPAGQGLPHDNMMPFQAVSFIIATEGVYPSHN